MNRNEDATRNSNWKSIRKTANQLQSLLQWFSEDQYPSQSAMENYASQLGLTYKQVRGWFIERRRKMKTTHQTQIQNQKQNQKKPILIQDLLYTPEYILSKVFRKDGPPLGVHFDSPPNSRDSRKSNPTCHENPKAPKRRKVSTKIIEEQNQVCNKSSVAKKHGMGKGLMTIWRATHPNGGIFPTGVNFVNQNALSVSQRSALAEKNRQKQKHGKQKRVGHKLPDKRKPLTKKRKVESKKVDDNQKTIHKKCQLALEGVTSLDPFRVLVDDEELELWDLQAGPNPLQCSAHLSTNGLHGCSLCKDLLPKFPPPSTVRVKKPFSMQPWDSSPSLVKKLFKVFHLLYTYSATMDICPFTLDEFAQSFHDKDSMLLGKIHVALLKVVLVDVEKGLEGGVVPCISQHSMFLAFLQSVEKQPNVVELWKTSLNSLTWIEILHQVLVAAGCGSKHAIFPNEALHKDVNLMVKYGLRPGTLKGELFKILSEQGNNGLKVSELAKLLPVAELNLVGRTSEELEVVICSTLSSDITLFEKISSRVYRLRIVSLTKEAEPIQLDSEDSGSVDDDEDDSDDECNSESYCRKSMITTTTLSTEIDESHRGEVWLLGLMEGEYADLSIEEKMSALLALVDLLTSGSTVAIQDPLIAISEDVPKTIHQHGSGAKIKKKTVNEVTRRGLSSCLELCGTPSDCPIDSSKSSSSTTSKDGLDSHPMQSVFLGSDRRYNRYWLFLGPCDENEPGHKRIYVESSEDGRWEVIDTKEALCGLLSVLDGRGRREARLLASLEKREASLCRAMSAPMSASDSGSRRQSEDSSSPVSDVDQMNDITEDSSLPCSSGSGAVVLVTLANKAQWNRLQKYDAWIWNSFYSNLSSVKHRKIRSSSCYLDSLMKCTTCRDLYWRDEKHCKACHTTFELDFDLEEKYAIHAAMCSARDKNATDGFPMHKVLSSQLQSLKAAVYAIESVMPEDALVGGWKKSSHNLWVKRLRRTSSMVELLQVLGDFVGAINEDWLCQRNVELGSGTILEEILDCFPILPQTSSAVALWLVKFDALIAPLLSS